MHFGHAGIDAFSFPPFSRSPHDSRAQESPPGGPGGLLLWREEGIPPASILGDANRGDCSASPIGLTRSFLALTERDRPVSLSGAEQPHLGIRPAASRRHPVIDLFSCSSSADRPYRPVGKYYHNCGRKSSATLHFDLNSAIMDVALIPHRKEAEMPSLLLDPRSQVALLDAYVPDWRDVIATEPEDFVPLWVSATGQHRAQAFVWRNYAISLQYQRLAA